MKEQCMNCRFWYDMQNVHPTMGQCRRFPPMVPVSQDRARKEGISDHSMFPETYTDDWCGEWKEWKPE